MKKNLIYIASDNRSGSTLLDHLLGSHKDILAVGELLNLHDHFNRKGIGRTWDWRCTCGEKIQNCKFWSNIIVHYEKKEMVDFSIVETAIKMNNNKFVDLLFSYFLFLISLPNVKKKKLLNCYYFNKHHQRIANNYFKILDNITEKANKAYIVDSSKTPEQLLALLNCKNNSYRIKLIYLVRDARATCHSRITRAAQLGARLSYVNAMVSWVKVNLKILNIKSFFKEDDYVMVRYEDLCLNTDQTIDNIFKMLNINHDRDLSKLKIIERHNIGGSPHRFEFNTKIQMDDRWKSSITLKKKIIFIIFGFFLNSILKPKK